MELSIIINTRNRKDMLFSLLDSLKSQKLNVEYETIVVDDCSDNDYTSEITQKYPNVKFIRNDQREFLIKSRNKGWQNASGKYVFFIDDDNEIKSPDMLTLALDTFTVNPDIGVLGCRTYYFDEPNKILVGPNKFNKYTGRTIFPTMNQSDNPKYQGIIDTHDNPNAFFTTKDLLLKTKGFSPEIVQTFSEADYAEKIRKLGLRVVQFSELKVYHKSPKVDFKNLSTRLLGGSPERFYYLMRNRYLFIRKYGTLLQIITYALIFSMIYNVYYLYITIESRDYKMMRSGLLGIFDGYLIILFNKIIQRKLLE